VFEPEDLDLIREAIGRQTAADGAQLGLLREEVRTRMRESRTIRPQATTAVSLVASDGGSNRLQFDPFSMQLVRVVDSNGRGLLLEVISPNTDPDALVARHRARGDALQVLMEDLGVETLNELSPMIPTSRRVREEGERVSAAWPQRYRDVAEWAVLYQRATRVEWAADTLLVRDGLLRSAIFRGELRARMRALMVEGIERRRRDGVRLFVVGIAKHSRVLTRYRLAMALEDTLPAGAPCYVGVPRELERRSYRWEEYAQGDEPQDEGGGAGLALGRMFLARFGRSAHDPVWPVDVLESQAGEAGAILGHLLADALDGFPVPLYPRCLQRAHEHAQIVDFDLDVLRDAVFEGVRALVGEEQREIVEGQALIPDVARLRYG
jgi:hypothetical protein